MPKSFTSDKMILNHQQALLAIKDFLEWGAKTSSDRDLFDNRFRKILNDAEVKFEEPKN